MFCDYFNLQDVAGTWQLQTDVPLTIAWGRGIYDPKLEVWPTYMHNCLREFFMKSEFFNFLDTL